MKIVAVDIGGTAIKAGLWDGTELTDMKEWDTEASQGRCPSDGAGNAAPPHLFRF